ncbi:MAG: filamentous hemagglutinin N-terminal domain-containing protein [Phormidesmis sp.]
MRIAQVIEDTTLGSEQSVVNLTTQNGATTYRITGGATRGANLFHSFDQFSVMADDTALFANSIAIENTIGRVTGLQVSTLDGKLQSAGSANLFLINPAGIVIGPNASLDIGGSFLASTGEGLRFANGVVYDTRAAQSPPLLTISAPIGLVIGEGVGDLSVTGGSASPGLAVPDGQTLALVGNDVSLTGAQLTAAGGRIEIASVKETNEPTLMPFSLGFAIDFDEVSDFGNIQILDQSIIDTSGTGGGTIRLHGQKITLTDQSALISDTLGNLNGQTIQIVADSLSLREASFIGAATLGSGDGSSIDITAADIEFIGTDYGNYKILEILILAGARQIADRQIGGISATTAASGRTGDISLSGQRLVLDRGVQVSTESLGSGDSGDIKISATDLVQITESGVLVGSRVSGIALITPDIAATGLSTSGIPAGRGGNIDISTTRLIIEDGSSIISATLSDRDAGKISIDATESVVLRGSSLPFTIPTSITAASLGGQGAAGDLDINTSRFLIQDGAIIVADSGFRTLAGNIGFGGRAGNVNIVATESVEVVGGRPLAGIFGSTAIRSRTYSEADAGKIQITTPVLSILDGGRITGETESDGTGGAIAIDAQTVVVSGVGNENPDSASGIFANSGSEAQVAFITGEIKPVPASGSGGSIRINAADLAVQNAAQITVGSFGSGAAGNVDITADKVRIENDGSLRATTTSDRGGNITLTANALALSSGSITASSESGDGGNLSFKIQDLLFLENGSLISTEAAAGNGGNIVFEGGLILAAPDENSDIIANAVAGNGGRILLTAQDVIGFEINDNLTTTQLRNNQTNDISASSELGAPGEVQIFNQVEDPTEGISELPSELLGGERLIGQSVCAVGPGSNFVVTGRGSVPISPQDSLDTGVVWTDERDDWTQSLRSLTNGGAAVRSSVDDGSPENSEQRESLPLVEAQGWSRLPDGQIALVAPSVSMAIAPNSPTCQMLSERLINE